MILNKITTLMSALLLVFAITTQAQTTIPNGNFEQWESVGNSTEEPRHWNSNKTGSGNASTAPQTCFRTGSAHGGSWCLRVKTANFIGIAVNGIATTGRVAAPSFNASDGYAGTVANDTSYHMDFTGRPDSLVGWYKFTSNGSVSGTIQVNLHTGAGALPESGSYQGNTTPNVVARAVFNTPTSTVSGWTRFSVPFVYVNGNIPEYFLAVMNSGNVVGNEMYLDDLQAIYNPTLATGTVNTGPHYVSSSAGASVSVPYTITGTYTGGNTFTAQLSNSSGSFSSPVNIGSVTSSAAGTINATIPAGTASGTGYRIRVVSSTPSVTGTNNGSNITINNVSASIAPTAAQTLVANTAGNVLTLTASSGSTATAWKYSTSSGGPYTAFSPAQTGSTYTPQFATAGTYYVVAEATYPGSLTVRSNEVTVNVVSNSVTPSASQSLLVGVSGNMLTVAETPAGTSREWKYATSSGGPYSSFSPAETGATYTPVFASAGTYYVVAQSVISGVTVTSNEVVVSVGSATITTGTITPLIFDFSPSAPNATISVPYTTSGTFNAGNVFTAQLSNASGSFNSPTNIGTVTATGSGTITATLPNTTPAGSGYRIRVVSDNPVVLGGDNGDDIFVDQFHNSIAPAATQTLMYGATGNTLTVTESQNATRQWLYSTTSGGPYSSFSPVVTGPSFVPVFNTPGTYYVVAQSENQYNDVMTSNEVQFIIQNGTTLSTGIGNSGPFYVSPSSNEQTIVSWTTDIIFDPSNTFTIELSDASGSFTSPVTLATAPNDSTSKTVTIPGNTTSGTGYRIRVRSSNPVATGTDNGSDLEVIQFEINVVSTSTQTIYEDSLGTPIVIQENHPATREWLMKTAAQSSYVPFPSPETDTVYTPQFSTAGTYNVIVNSVNQWNDTLTSPTITIIVEEPIGIGERTPGSVKAWWQHNTLMVDLTASKFENPDLKLVNLAGQVVLESTLQAGTLNRLNTNLPEGIYILQLQSIQGSATAKTLKQ